MTEHVVLIGTRGWLHAQWSGEFYPDDIPPEWQLGYYGNEYPVVMVPASYWAEGAAQADDWLEESDDSLRFLCEWPTANASPLLKETARQGIARLTTRTAGILIRLSADATDEQWQEYRDLQGQYALCFDIDPEYATDGQAQLAERFAATDYGICWHGNVSDAALTGQGRLVVCRLRDEPPPKVLRQIIQTLIDASKPGRTVILIVDGEPPEMKLLTNAGIMLDLL